MTRLERQVFRAVKQFWHERKTKFGAFVAVARRAEVDATGRLVAIRVRPANPATQQEPPSQEIVRQVRRCFHKAKNHLDRRRKERDGDE